MKKSSWVALTVVLAWVSLSQAAVNIETVPVGNPGNVADSRYGGYGSVSYAYNIGKYEVTAGQYTEFLNAVAATDTYGLYNISMWSGTQGCKIERTGSPGSYTYSVAPAWANRPVNCVSWGDAARFANWMHNGQPTGSQDSGTTENGSYFLNGAMSNSELLAATRETNARWVIPSENEWYKAAYHKNDGINGDYFDYPTGTDNAPNNGNPEGDTGNSANFYDGDYAVDEPYWRNEVGYFTSSNSPYGTFDQGGNVWEWNEAVIGSYRGTRGGAYYYYSDSVGALRASYRLSSDPTGEYSVIGFRVAAIPEPASIVLLAVGCAAVLSRRRKLGR